MPKIHLTEKSLAALPTPQAGQVIYRDNTLTGFGVVVGTESRTFVVRARVGSDGARRQVKLGIAGRPRPDGRLWTVALARDAAKDQIGQMATGKDPNPSAPNPNAGPTLREGIKLHTSNMRKDRCSERSIETLESELIRLLPQWLDRPIVEMRGADLVGIHDRITSEGKKALANRLVSEVSAVWGSLDRKHELDGRNPARAVKRNPNVPSRERVADSELTSWWSKVQTLAPIRRDLQVFMLCTGMRSEAARFARWEHLDTKIGALVVPEPKGGSDKAFKLPVPPKLLERLAERRAGNAADPVLRAHGGDGGWMFPSLSRETPAKVQPLAQPRELRGTAGARVSFIPSPHVLRRTYLSVAAEAGVSELDRHVLANHAFGRQNVNATYIEQAFPHLAECQASIEAALWKRIGKAAPPTAERAIWKRVSFENSNSIGA